MADERPDPDVLLARVNAEAARQSRGKLKIFFGAAPGVGKTYAMLEAARKEGKDGADVVIGYVEPHVRPETAALVLGLDLLARRKVEYGGTVLQEFDLEAALARRPQLLIVDELAHTNAPGATHAKRWQDVEQLLQAGIDVYTTLNVQHLESLNDVVAQIIGTTVRETVPDSVFDAADEIELVDLAPDDLVERLKEGKVYIAPQAERAIQNFFRKGNLIALRELALRRTAERVNLQMESYRTEHAIASPTPISERLLVCIGPSPFAGRLIRATRRMAASLKAPWVAVHVETPGTITLSPADRARLSQNMHLAEQLGGQTVTLSGASVVDEVIAYAHRRNVSKIIAGKSQLPRWREFLFGSFVYELTRRCGDIDVYIISGEPAEERAPASRQATLRRPRGAYAWSLALVAACTGIGLLASLPVHLDPEPATLVNVVMVYLVGIMVTALWLGRGPSMAASLLSVVVFDFCFVPPRWTFAVTDAAYLFTFMVMLCTGVLISHLTWLARQQARAARDREQYTAALYSLSRALAVVEDMQEIVQVVVRTAAEAFGAQVVALLPAPSEGLAPRASHPAGLQLAPRDLAVARWVLAHGQQAGLGTATLSGADMLFVPLTVSQKTLGVLGILPGEKLQFADPEQMHLLEAFAGQAAAALERAQLAADAEQVRLQVEAERMRNSLLSAVSHDLRTPLAAIAGASSTLLDGDAGGDPAIRRELLQTVYEEADRLNHLVGNLLEATRLDGGSLTLRREWQSLEEIIGAVLHRLSKLLGQHPVSVHLPPDLPLILGDGALLQEVLGNLLDNARKYTPPQTPIEISAVRQNGNVVVEVADRGPGFPPGTEGKLFEKFYRSDTARQRAGVGLGLTICKGIVELHGGTITARARDGGGAVFRLTLPIGGVPPRLAEEEVAAPAKAS